MTWTEDGQEGINSLIWDLTPQKQPVRKGVYESALVLVRAGTYALEIVSGEEALEGKIEVNNPEQRKVGIR